MLVEAIAFAANLDQVRVVHEPIENGRNGWRVAEQLRPVVKRLVYQRR